MSYIIIGLFAAFNLIIIKVKFEAGRYGDGILDIVAGIILAALLGGTLGGMVIAMIASVIISLYLYVSPPRLFKEEGTW